LDDGSDVISNEEVTAVIKAHKKQLVDCAAEQSQMQPELHGVLKLQWMVSPNGTASQVKAMTPNLVDSYLAACIGEQLPGWKFPSHRREGLPITYPFRF
jgi:hypothetical protein